MIHLSYFPTFVLDGNTVAYSQIRNKGQVTIPNDVREAAHLEEGTMVEFTVTDQGVLLRPKAMVDAEDAWFWTKEWQQGEREAQAELAAGGEVYTDDEFLNALEERSK
jgi:AbrB family looped-hinge helix DNA binding protein